METGRDGLPVLVVEDAAAWDAWLDTNSSSSPGVWLKIAKKASGEKSVSYKDAVEVGLCHGWIDGQKGAWDESWFVQRFTRRSARSGWSQVNVDTVERLRAAGRMRPAGEAEVQRAKASGAWDRAYAPASTITVPDDLQVALDANPAAAEAFSRLSKTERYSALYRVQQPKRPETRARQIQQLVKRLADLD